MFISDDKAMWGERKEFLTFDILGFWGDIFDILDIQ